MQGDGKELESLQHFIQISEFSGRVGFHPPPPPLFPPPPPRAYNAPFVILSQQWFGLAGCSRCNLLTQAEPLIFYYCEKMIRVLEAVPMIYLVAQRGNTGAAANGI